MSILKWEIELKVIFIVEQPPSCRPAFTKWSTCSTTCGAGLSTRKSNLNARCEPATETRVCQTRRCDDTPLIQQKTQHHLRVSLSQCYLISARLIKLNFVSYEYRWKLEVLGQKGAHLYVLWLVSWRSKEKNLVPSEILGELKKMYFFARGTKFSYITNWLRPNSFNSLKTVELHVIPNPQAGSDPSKDFFFLLDCLASSSALWLPLDLEWSLFQDSFTMFRSSRWLRASGYSLNRWKLGQYNFSLIAHLKRF